MLFKCTALLRLLSKYSNTKGIIINYNNKKKNSWSRGLVKSRQKNGRDSRSRETEVGEKIAVTSTQSLLNGTLEIFKADKLFCTVSIKSTVFNFSKKLLLIEKKSMKGQMYGTLNKVNRVAMFSNLVIVTIISQHAFIKDFATLDPFPSCERNYTA